MLQFARFVTYFSPIFGEMAVFFTVIQVSQVKNGGYEDCNHRFAHRQAMTIVLTSNERSE